MNSTTEQESTVIGMVLKTLHDLKSDMGTIKKILNIFDETKASDAVNPRHKSAWRPSKRREKWKSRFAGAMVKCT